jgi:hypothetical protein
VLRVYGNFSRFRQIDVVGLPADLGIAKWMLARQCSDQNGGGGSAVTAATA